MPRYLIAALVTFALLAVGLAATPAQAAWSRPGDLTKYRVCRASVDGGDGWRFVSKVRRYAHTPDARAGIRVYSGHEVEAHWSSGWLTRGETEIWTVRVPKSKRILVQIWQEAGDRDSSIGTATEITVLKPKKIKHC